MGSDHLGKFCAFFFLTTISLAMCLDLCHSSARFDGQISTQSSYHLQWNELCLWKQSRINGAGIVPGICCMFKRFMYSFLLYGVKYGRSHGKSWSTTRLLSLNCDIKEHISVFACFRLFKTNGYILSSFVIGFHSDRSLHYSCEVIYYTRLTQSTLKQLL